MRPGISGRPASMIPELGESAKLAVDSGRWRCHGTDSNGQAGTERTRTDGQYVKKTKIQKVEKCRFLASNLISDKIAIPNSHLS